MKRVIKYFLILVVSLVVIGGILYMLLVVFFAMVFSGGSELEGRQEELGLKAQEQIVLFYQKNGYYPRNLQDIPLYNDPDFVTLLHEKRIFHYTSYGTDGKQYQYTFSWKGGAMNWTGYQCTNRQEKHPTNEYGVIRRYSMPGGTVCTVTDLH